MAHVIQLPCDADGLCMSCKTTPLDYDIILCNTCVTPWHKECVLNHPEALTSAIRWDCPDCCLPSDVTPVPAVQASGPSDDLIVAVRAIEADCSLSDAEKAKRRQDLMTRGRDLVTDCEASETKGKKRENDVLEIFDGTFNCSFCMQLPERPVTTPCGHNFCLKCFQKWTGQGKKSCAKCRASIPRNMASQPRINSALVAAIRMAKTARSISLDRPQVHPFIHNQNRPEKAFTTERAKKSGKANACSGKIFVTVPPDHFGPILAENDPDRKTGVLVGELWEDRMECRQWGAHLPHIAGIAGQAEYGAQSVALSGGYEDDEDHGEWFLYTGSGGRDLSGNKRTNKEQSFDQKFDKMNEALRVSCKKGYPVRVVRSHKEKRSAYAPENGVRYDGIYRIEKCWRKVGNQGFKVCRYLFVRCDNEPAPWTSDEQGDRPRPLPDIKELEDATDVTERKGSPAWDYEEEHGWKWTKPQPVSRKQVNTGNPEERKIARRAIRDQKTSVREKLLKEFSCLICKKVMTLPLTTPCAHNFCKLCLEGVFAGRAFVRERSGGRGRTLRAQKNIMKCPSCPTDISDFLQNPQVNRELMDVIESLQQKTEENVEEASKEGVNGADGKNLEAGDEGTEFSTSTVSTETTESSDKDGGNLAVETDLSLTCKRKMNGDLCNPSDSDEKTTKKSKKSDEAYDSPLLEEGVNGADGKNIESGDEGTEFSTSTVNTETTESGDKDGGNLAVETDLSLTCKRKMKVDLCNPSDFDEKTTKKSKNSDEAQKEGNDSPSSPLHDRSNGADVERCF